MKRCKNRWIIDVSLMTPWRIDRLRSIFRCGGIIAYASEGVYGLGCNPFDRRAVERLLQLKGRAVQKGLIVVAESFTQCHRLVAPLIPSQIQQLHNTWPGPVTWVVPARTNAPVWLTGGRSTLAIRVSDHPVVRFLCGVLGTLVSTSANFSGHRSLLSAVQVRNYLGHQVDCIVDGALQRPGVSTEIRNLRTGAVLRRAHGDNV